ncbi:MAG: hypothetical protein KKD17_01010 [Nanoarchaeota archaeon]|nr:hypothetical protein [Nanoarchaeota archaeon]
MLDNKKKEELQKRIKEYLKRGIIKKEKDTTHAPFFLDNARLSLDTAKILLKITKDDTLRKTLGAEGYNGSLWIVNSCYYSMFYMTRALLEKEGIKLNTDRSIHAVTFDALVHFFYLTGKLEKKLIEDFAESQEEAAETLGREKAKELIDSYFNEKDKRARFTYETGMIAMQSKAETSFARASKFNEEIRKIIGK